MTAALSIVLLLLSWADLMPQGLPQEYEPVPGHGGIVRRAGARDGWLGLGLGTGLGMTVSDSRDVRMGYSVVGYIAPELGVHLGDAGRFGASLWSRVQIDRPLGEPTVSAAAMARLFAFEREPGECGSATSRWYGYVGVGAGSVLLSREHSSASEVTRSGPMLLGLGVGVVRNLGARLGIFADIGVLAAAPDVAFALELSIGVQLSRPKQALLDSQGACLVSSGVFSRRS